MAGTATGNAIQSTVSGSGSGTVTSVTAADSSIVAGGTPGVSITLATGTLDVIAADHPPAADWSNNSHKITSLANGSAASDAAAFGQIPVLSASAPLSLATTPAAGSGSQSSKQDHQHPREFWDAPDHNLIAWTCDPAVIANTTTLVGAGTMFTVKLHLTTAQNITNMIINLTTAGSGLTSGQCFMALYQGVGGSLLGTSADQSVIWAGATGVKTTAISGGAVAAAAGDLIVGMWYNGTTGPTFSRGSGTSLSNVGLSAANSRFGTANTGLTTTAPGTLGTIAANSAAFWVGLS